MHENTALEIYANGKGRVKFKRRKLLLTQTNLNVQFEACNPFILDGAMCAYACIYVGVTVIT